MAPDPTPPAWQQAPAENPMAIHVKVIAILELVWGILAAIGAVFAVFVFSAGSALFRSVGEQPGAGWLADVSAALGFLITAVLVALAVVAILGATRLLALKRSGRTLTYVSAALSLLSFPIGTAFGIYAFVILTRPDTDRLLANP
jgi:hypothetical protein